VPTLLLQLTGWSLAHLPRALLRGLSQAVGALIFYGIPRRRRLLLSNLIHAFPRRDGPRIRALARKSCRRLAETGLLSLASPYLSDAQLRQIARLGPGAEATFTERLHQPRPIVLASLHLAYWETQTWLGLLSPTEIGEFGVIYRPLDDASADLFIRRTRERFGMRLLSRKQGFAQALNILRRNGTIGVLFDQNAGLQGALTTLFGRVCSTTELPGIMAEKFKGDVRAIFPRRLGFWQVELCIESISHDGTAAGVTIALNRWLETRLSSDEGLCASWLWSHSRWRNQDIPSKRLRLEAKRNLLKLDLKSRGWTELPRSTRIYVRLPNWLGDVVMAIPLLRALRASRPDAELTLVGKSQFRSLVEAAGVADRYEPLPKRGLGYWRHFHAFRKRYPDVYLLLTNSIRGDMEAWLSRCPQRFGLRRTGKLRFGLTHSFRPESSYDEREHHQLDLWENVWRHFGLDAPIDRTPLEATDKSPRARHATRPLIGLIAGSENMPSKRWPVAHWRALLAALPEHRFVLFGTPGDRPIAQAIADGHSNLHVENAAGKTDLAGFVLRLCECSLLVTNDTGGMHLGNAFGVPLIGLFGPTNPVRTRPVFASRVEIMQPPGCPPTGGGSLDRLKPEAVVARVRAILAENVGTD